MLHTKNTFVWSLSLFLGACLLAISFSLTPTTAEENLNLDLPSFTAIDAGTPEAFFTDVSKSSDKFPAMKVLKQLGIIEGYSDGTLKMDQDINRAEFTKIVVEAKEKSDPSFTIEYDPAHSFPDVAESAWYAKYVSTAKKWGIIQGYPDGNFKPSQNINFPEAYKIILKTLGIDEKDGGYLPYTLDEHENEWFAPFVGTVNSKNLSPELHDMSGIDDLAKSISRGAAFDALYRTHHLVTVPEPPDRFQRPDFFFGEHSGVIHTPLKAPYYLPVAYRGFIKGPIQGKLYKMSVDTFLKTQKKKEDDDCCMMHRDLGYHVADELVSEMELVSSFETEIKGIPDPEEILNNYNYKTNFIAVPVEGSAIYLLRVEDEYIPEEDVILIPSNLSLLQREGSENQLVWAVNDTNKAPISGTTVNFYDTSGDIPQLSHTATTDADGVIFGGKHDADVVVGSSGDQVAVLIANSGGGWPIPEPMPMMRDMEVMAVEPAFDEPMIWPGPGGGNDGAYKVYAYSDRPIYRPGQTVKFKGIIRKNNAGNYALPDQSTVTVSITNTIASGESTIFEKELSLSEYGSYNSEAFLDPEVNTGTFSIKTKIGETSYHSGTFEVEAYKKHDFDLEINLNKDQVVQGDNVQATIEGKYFFGQPYANKQVTYTIYKSGYYVPLYRGSPWKQFEDFIDIAPPYYGGQEYVDSGTISLDSNGRGILNFKPALEQDNQSREYTIEVTSTDESNAPVTTRKNLVAHAAAFNLFVEGEPFAKNGRSYTATVTTIDHSERAFAGTELKLMLKRSGRSKRECGNYFDHWEHSMLPRFCFDYEEEVVLEKEGNTDANGKYEFEFTPEKGGSYTLEVIAYDFDQRDRKMRKTHYFSVDGEEDASSSRYISVHADKTVYEAGSTATFNVHTSIDSGTALVTFAKDDIFEKKIVNFSDSNFTTSVVVNDNFVPGFSVSVDIFDRLNFLHGTEHAAVYPEQKKLDIQVIPSDSQALPEDTISWIVIARDINGNPVQGELSLALVDKAIYQIRKHKLADVFKEFYKKPSYSYISVRTTQKQDLLKSYPPSDGDDEFGRGAVMMDMMEGGAVPAMAPEPDAVFAREEKSMATGAAQKDGAQILREVFEDTGGWVANIETNAEGIGRADITLPHNLTTWVGVSLGVTKDTKVGVGEGEVLVTKDVIIRPFVPRFVTLKDELKLRAAVHNYLDTEAVFRIYAKQVCGEGASADCIEKSIATPIKLNVDAKEEVTINWDYIVPKYLKDGEHTELEFMVEKESDITINDRVKLSIPVHGLGVKKTHSQAGEGAVTYRVKPESFDTDNIQKLIVYLSPTLTDNLAKSLEYLTGYPYGCTEQTMSRFLPNVVAWMAKDTLEFQDQTMFDELPDQVRSGLQRLYKFQHYDGGWGWWRDDESSDKNSTYVLYGLLLAQKAGFKVEQNVLDQAVSYLETRLTTTDAVNFHPYMLHVLSMYNPKPQYKEQGDKFLQKVDIARLPSIDLAHLMMWESYHGSQQYQAVFRNELEKRIEIAGNLAHFEEDVVDYENMSSSELTTAVVASTFAKLGLRPDLTEKMIRWLDQKRNGFSYHETHATSHAVMALVEYLSQNKEGKDSSTYTVKLNGVTEANGTLTELQTIEIPATRLATDDNEITIEKNGSGKMYYTIVVEEFLPEDFVGAYDNGFSVKTRFVDEDNFTATKVNTQDTVKVLVDIEAHQDSYYTSIFVPLPAGLEPINPRLEQNINYYDHGSGLFNFRDFYDDHMTIFVTYLPKGSYQYTFKARAITPGTFSANPTTVEMMYAPQVNGASDGGKIEVVSQ